jgi:hypothetical protein
LYTYRCQGVDIHVDPSDEEYPGPNRLPLTARLMIAAQKKCEFWQEIAMLVYGSTLSSLTWSETLDFTCFASLDLLNFDVNDGTFDDSDHSDQMSYLTDSV